MYVKIAHRDGALFSWYFHLAAVPRWVQRDDLPVKLESMQGKLRDLEMRLKLLEAEGKRLWRRSASACSKKSISPVKLRIAVGDRDRTVFHLHLRKGLQPLLGQLNCGAKLAE